MTQSTSSPSPRTPALTWPEPAREQFFTHWLNAIAAAQALKPDSLRIASADASFRRYLRIDTLNGATRIIMDAPPDKEDCKPFAQVAQLMHQAGVNAPQVLEWDEANGFMLLTDLGTQTMLDVMQPADPLANLGLYKASLDALLAWQLASKPGVLPPYNEALLRRELELFPEWYLGKYRGMAVDGKVRETLDKVFAQIIAHNLNAPSVFVHRDFMPRNLMVAGDASQTLGVLDFQDAVYGPVTYDIASLMRDAFLSWDEEFVMDVTIRYWERARKLGLLNHANWSGDFGEFYRAVEWMGLQRHLKILGIFARLTLRDGKPKYLADTPRFVTYLRGTCARYVVLRPLMNLIDEADGTQAVVAYSMR
jgi:N-acetylmuramate 1-kinase